MIKSNATGSVSKPFPKLMIDNSDGMIILAASIKDGMIAGVVLSLGKYVGSMTVGYGVANKPEEILNFSENYFTDFRGTLELSNE